MTNPIKPTLIDVIEAALERLQVHLRTCIPAKVVSYSPTPEPWAAVQPATSSAVRDSGEEVKLPQIANAPVMFPYGGGWEITWPLAPGDPVWLLIADRAIDEWRRTGRVGKPGDGRMHNLTDAVVIPMGAHAGKAPTGGSATDLVIRGSTGVAIEVTAAGKVEVTSTTEVEVEAPSVKLGSGASQKLLKGTLFQPLYDEHTHLTPVGPSWSPAVTLAATDPDEKGLTTKAKAE